MRKLLVAVLTIGAISLLAPPSFAACTGTSVPMLHQGSWFVCRDSSEVAAFAWQLNAPTTVNTGRENISCEAADNIVCFGGGQRDDGQVTIETDWGNPTIVGCPDVAGAKQRVVISVQCGDGSGLLVSLGGAGVDVFGAYLLEAAHPADTSPLVAGNQAGKPFINQATDNGDGTMTLSLRFPASFRVFNDCDAGSFGQANGVCQDGFVPSATVGRLFTSTQLCRDAAGNPLPPNMDRGQWTVNAVTPDATGNATLTVQKPTLTNNCLFVGASTMLNGNETGGITGFVAVGGPGAASPVAVGVRAEQAAGNISVRWHTDSEINLAGFNVLTEGKKGTLKVSDAMIPAKGNGGAATYTESIPRGKFQGSRTVIIESVLTDGTTLKSAPAKF